jgi:hypothetical protein
MLFLSLVAAELKRRGIGAASPPAGTVMIGSRLGTQLRGEVRRVRSERSL